jgi:general stress protein 26
MERNQLNDFSFLKEKINSIKVAIFRSELDSELQIPSNIVQTLKVEDDGTIWFFTTLNGYHAAMIDKPFYAHLDYHKKGIDCKLKLEGEAIISDYAGYDLCSKSNHTESIYAVVLVKMKITHAEVIEKNNFTNKISLPQKIKTVINNLFVPQQKIYNFSY